MWPNPGLEAESGGTHQGPPCVHPGSMRPPRVHGEDRVDGVTGREAGRVQVSNHEDLRVDGPAERGRQTRVLSSGMKRQPRPGGPGDIARRIAYVGHGENAKGSRVRINRESAATKKGRSHARGRARNDTEADHGAVLAGVRIVRINVTHMGQSRGAEDRSQGGGDLCGRNLPMRTDQPFQVVPLGRGGKS